MTAMASSTADVHGESAAAPMQVDTSSVMDQGEAAVHEAVHDAEAPTASLPAPLPMLSQVADEPVPAKLNATQEPAQLADQVHAQHQENRATVQSSGAASVTQPANTHGGLQPAKAPPTVQSEDADALPNSACNPGMAEAPEDHAPSQHVDAVASSGLAEGAAVAHVMEEHSATQLCEGTALTEPADMSLIGDQAANPMQTDLPAPQDQGMASADKHGQPQLGTAEVDPPETAQPPAKLHSSKSLAADAQHSMPREMTQPGVDHPPKDVASSGYMPENGVLDTVKPTETSTATAPGTVPAPQNSESTRMTDPSAYRLAEGDTDMENATSQGDGLTEHPMHEAEPVSRSLRQSKQTLPGHSEAESDVRSGIGAGGAESPPNQPTPSPSGLEV